MANQPVVYYGETDSPLGLLTIAGTDDGVCRLDFGGVEQTEANLRLWTKKHFHKSELIRDDEALSPVVRQLDEYFHGERYTFDLPLLLRGTAFQQNVWKALTRIGYGETRTYKEVARAIGADKAVRAVGGANNKNPLSIIIPCHRVIGSNGTLVGYGGGVDKKEYLLGIERTYANMS